MDTGIKQEQISAKGMEIFRLMESDTPTMFGRKRWLRELMQLAMHDPGLKVRLFRFVDVFPTLTTPELVAQHLREYFLSGEPVLPGTLRLLLSKAATPHLARVTAALLRRNIAGISRLFISGETPEEALKALRAIWNEGRNFTVDILGEAALSEREALAYHDRYLELIDILNAELARWPSNNPERERRFPRLNVSVKASSLYSRIGPLNYDDSVTSARERLRPILRRARDVGGFVNLDMEMYSLKNITLDLFTGLLAEPEFAGWNGAGVAIQSYLKESENDLRRLIAWARDNDRRPTVRLVKGAYWEYETIVARQKGWPVPVFTEKGHTDSNFERCADILLEHRDYLTPVIATHNVRSLAATLVTAERLGVSANEYEFQMLFGMAGSVKNALARLSQPVRDYAPTGELLPGMAYLVRRLLENTSNEGFLRKTFVDGVERKTLLAAPLPYPGEKPPPVTEGPTTFANEPTLDFSQMANRNACLQAIGMVRRELGLKCPALIGGEKVTSGQHSVSTNPALPEEVVGSFAGVDRDLVERALLEARKAQPAWGEKRPEERAGLLFRAAAITRARRMELMAWQVLETGKNWAEADADVCEAIDFLEYYGREMIRLGQPRKLGDLPGEENLYFYHPRGVGAVIAPWNFPLAISVGMTAAALVAGNAVLYKPASLSVINGWQMVRIFMEAGAPQGVLNFIPGYGEEIGKWLADHPQLDFIAFTGSREVGMGLLAQAAHLSVGQRSVRRVIAEMGGKNAIIVDADADLDQAVAGVIQSAFGYQGQKCSACSRAIVLAPCYDRFLERLCDAVQGITVGPPEDPSNFMGPVIDGRARERILAAIEIGRRSGRIAAQGKAPTEGYYVPPTLLADLPPDSPLLREEIFGPVLAVVRVADMDEALRISNDTDYALTGGIYSRSPATIDRVRRELAVGNLYINRGITGALVGRQPFGGFRLSGIGSKAGGPDYLLQFLEPRVITENTMRRGFTPEVLA